MMRKPASFLLPLLLLLQLQSCAVKLDVEGWTPEVHSALDALVQDKTLRGSYAVFDCDNTSVLHDVTHTLMLYQIENLRFATAPEHRFLDGLQETDFVLDGLSITAGQMGECLRDEYISMRRLLDSGSGIEDVRRTEVYLDFRARFLAFYKAIGRNYDYGTLCLWMPALTTGMSPAEARSLGKESLDFWLSKGRVWREKWVSPDGKFKGEAQKGLVVTPAMKNLYRALEKAGIIPYICSASPEWLVELLACDPQKSFGLDTSQVFGIRLLTSANGTLSYDPDYPQPFKQGKVENIEAFMAPRHANKAPVLVGGDSEGDIAMLTRWPEMRVGLIMDQYRGGEISSLARSGLPFVAQPVVIAEEQRLRRALQEEPFRAGGCYHSYEAGYYEGTPAPRGFKPFYINHYGRHGSRYHTPKMISRCYPQALLTADSLGKLTPYGEQVLDKMMAMYRLHDGRTGELSARGAAEHRGIAARMAARFPSVFSGRDSVVCRSSGYSRCNLSMLSFGESLASCASSLKFSFDSTEANFNLLARSFIDQKEMFAEITAYQHVMRDRHFDVSRIASVLFKDSYVPEDLQMAVKGIYIYGCMEEDLDNPLPGTVRLFDIFTPEELFAQWTIYSDVVYGEMGNSLEYGHRVMPAPAGLLRDMVDAADRAIAGGRIAADLRFGHDNGLVPLAFLIGLEGFTSHISFEGSWKEWPSFEKIPMASNLQMIFYRNRRGEILVKLLYNEKETLIPALEPFKAPYYRWEDLRAYLITR